MIQVFDSIKLSKPDGIYLFIFKLNFFNSLRTGRFVTVN